MVGTGHVAFKGEKCIKKFSRKAKRERTIGKLVDERIMLKQYSRIRILPYFAE
jgi:hypothetical protein